MESLTSIQGHESIFGIGFSGQFHRYLRAEYDLPGEVHSLRRPGPLPFNPGEIHRKLLEWSRA